MSKKYGGLGTSSPTKEQIDLLEWQKAVEKYPLKASEEQRKQFDDTYEVWE